MACLLAAVKSRVDQVLVDRGLCESRTRAQRAIMAGQVRINGHPARKSSDVVRDGDHVDLLAGDRFVSRGGHKLEHALDHFGIAVAGTRCLDLGASTGGFTDCLLQRGATRVWAVDVGTNQLAWKLRSDPRVVSLEQTNARHLTPDCLGADWTPCDLVVADCSFISLRLVLPVVPALLREEGAVLALVKPQFEAGRDEANRGEGVIVDPAVHLRVLDELRAFTAKCLPALNWCGVTESPLLGPAGNKEFLALLQHRAS